MIGCPQCGDTFLLDESIPHDRADGRGVCKSVRFLDTVTTFVDDEPVVAILSDTRVDCTEQPYEPSVEQAAEAIVEADVPFTAATRSGSMVFADNLNVGSAPGNGMRSAHLCGFRMREAAQVAQLVNEMWAQRYAAL